MFDFPLYYGIVDVFAGDHGFGHVARPELSDNEPWGVLNQDLSYRDAAAARLFCHAWDRRGPVEK